MHPIRRVGEKCGWIPTILEDGSLEPLRLSCMDLPRELYRQ